MGNLFFGAGAGVPSSIVRVSRRVTKIISGGSIANQMATVRARRSVRPVRKVLILSDGRAGTSEQQFAPLHRYRQTIARELGLLFEFGSVDKIDTISADQISAYDAVGLKLAFDTPTGDAVAKANKLFETARAVNARCLVFDGDDDQCILWPDVIEASDAYIKKHCFSEPKEYARSYIGKSNLTDHAADTYGVDFSSDIIPETHPLTDSQIAKIILGWNIALDDKIYNLAQDITPAKLRRDRKIDVSCRASVGPDQWTYGIRNDAVVAITALQEKLNVHAPTDRVSQQEYYNEMLNSWLTVSPFGYGELCWRDFEAILCGSVLVKPDVSHITTYPDLFVPGETYVSVAWDYSNLEDKCTSILDDTAARERIAQTARKKLLDALTPKTFLDCLHDTMRKAGVTDYSLP